MYGFHNYLTTPFPSMFQKQSVYEQQKVNPCKKNFNFLGTITSLGQFI